MKTEIVLDASLLSDALAEAGRDARLRGEVFEALRAGEAAAADPARFREEVRWPLIMALLRDVPSHRVTLADGLAFDVGADSRIEKALLLSAQAHPDHIWEPQTTKLLTALAARATQIVVGGAYIGDHVLPMARRMPAGGVVHAFEPMEHSFDRLCQNIAINGIGNVVANRLGLWDSSTVVLSVDGAAALATTAEYDGGGGAGQAPADDLVPAVTIDDYLASRDLASVDLIMLDTEGGEERALRGARAVLAQPPGQAPTIVFEVHRDYVDWGPGLATTSVVRLLLGHGYTVFAVRDIHANHPMDGQPIEVVPVDDVYTEGPPHGFNMLAVKDPRLVDELGLQIVPGVSPKLILEKDPALHHPVGGFARRPASS